MAGRPMPPDDEDYPTRASMDEVVMEKEALLAALRTNRETHRGIFEEALAGYEKEGVRQLQDHIKRIRAGSVKVIQVFLPAPQDHTDDYDLAIAMMEASLFDTVIVSKAQFNQYVLDNWTWKQEFLTANSAYSVTAQAAVSSR